MSRAFQVGDEVVITFMDVCKRRRYVSWRGQVSKVHKTGHVVANGEKFRQDGTRVGGSIWRPNEILRHSTPEIESEIAASAAMDAAETQCSDAAKILKRARDEDAIRLAALLPPELMPEAAE